LSSFHCFEWNIFSFLFIKMKLLSQSANNIEGQTTWLCWVARLNILVAKAWTTLGSCRVRAKLCNNLPLYLHFTLKFFNFKHVDLSGSHSMMSMNLNYLIILIFLHLTLSYLNEVVFIEVNGLLIQHSYWIEITCLP
jgi:hypothetical protein